MVDYCFGNPSIPLAQQCLPGQSSLLPETSNFTDICCCSFASCIDTLHFKPEDHGSLSHLVLMAFLLLFFCILFGVVCRGIRYDWLNIPFFVVELVYDPPEHVQWVDPWRDQTSPAAEERGFFKTRAALEIYIKKKHQKTSSDLLRYWHEHAGSAGGMHIP